jgi:NADP-dependent 3-hydroxy acid dehydrogenase YdfG
MFAIVTGASRGIGRKICERLVDRELDIINSKIIGIARSRDLLDTLYEKLGPSFEDHVVDIRRPGEIEHFIDSIKCYGELDVLVNNAGIFSCSPFLDCPEFRIENIIDTNLIGTMIMTHAVLPILRPGGRIINISSVSALHGIKNQAVYSASKAGIKAFGESLGQEGFNVTTIYPGGVDTPLWNDKNPYMGDKEEMLKSEDVAKAVEFVIDLPLNVVVKEIVMFPKQEQH